MNFKTAIDGDKLIITVDISKQAFANAVVSKSALKKAQDKGLPEPAPSLIATTGGFTSVGNVKLSLNVTK